MFFFTLVDGKKENIFHWKTEIYENPFLLFIFCTNARDQKRMERVENNWRVTESRRGESEKTKKQIARKRKCLAQSCTTSKPPHWKFKFFLNMKNFEGILATSNIFQFLLESLLFDFMFHLFSLQSPEEWVNGCRILLFKLLNHYLSFWNKLLLLCAIHKTKRTVTETSYSSLSSSILQSSQKIWREEGKNWTNSEKKIVSTNDEAKIVK